MATIFRWAAWEPSREMIFMLSHSVASFQAWFGSTARYIVFTDQPMVVRKHMLGSFEIERLDMHPERIEFLDKRCTWRKWAPVPRLDAGSTEFRIDADIFLLRRSQNIEAFISDALDCSIIVTQEEFHENWPYGNFAARLVENFKPINAGFVGQGPGCDIGPLLRDAYQWWISNVADEEIKYHDEQGAVAWALEQSELKVHYLDPDKYRVVCPLNDPPVDDVSEIVLLHATYPEHPAFWKHIAAISAVTNLPASM